jgi:hypothetical protein
MSNITVSNSIDSFLKTTSKTGAARSIQATPIDSNNKIIPSYVNGNTYTPLLFQANNTNDINSFSVFTTPIIGSFFITYDSNTLALHASPQISNIQLYAIVPGNISVYPGDVFPYINSLAIQGNGNIYFDSTIQTRLPILNYIYLAFNYLTIPSNLPRSLNSITLVSAVYPSSGVDNFLITLNNSVTTINGYCDLTDCTNKPTSASRTSRNALTARGWSISY